MTVPGPACFTALLSRLINTRRSTITGPVTVTSSTRLASSCTPAAWARASNNSTTLSTSARRRSGALSSLGDTETLA